MRLHACGTVTAGGLGPALIRSLLGRPGALAAADILTSDEIRTLHRPRPVPPARRTGPNPTVRCSTVNEAQAELSDPPRRYGHIVVDEAQDLSAMALRMVSRRSLDGRSLTILGTWSRRPLPVPVTRRSPFVTSPDQIPGVVDTLQSNGDAMWTTPTVAEVAVLAAGQAKGLEFDAVVVVERADYR